MRVDQNFKQLLFKARKLRKHHTDAEQFLWQLLRNRQLAGYKFRRQYPLLNFIVDFICVERRLVIELDGSQHLENIAYDRKRSTQLKRLGLQVKRYWNHEVLEYTDAVLDDIYTTLTLPSPASGRG